MNAFIEFLTLDNLTYMLFGLVWSVIYGVIVVLVGTVLGIIGAALKISKHKVLQSIGGLYTTVFIGTPMMLQILFFAVALPQALSFTGMRFEPTTLGVVAMCLNAGAYQTELIRSGILGVDKGQWEATETLGLSYFQAMRYVILPQAFKRIIPPLISEFMTLIKDSSLLYNIGAIELTASASVLGSRSAGIMIPYLDAGIMYIVIYLILSRVEKMAERRLAVSD